VSVEGAKHADTAPGPAAPTAVSAKVAYGLSVATGALYFLGFPSLDLWPFSLVAFVPLIVALEGQKPRRALGLGFTAGLVMNALGLYWLYPTMRRFSELPVPVCVALTLLVCGYQGLRIGVLGWLYARARSRAWPWVPGLAVSFVASELVYPLIFPWYFGACAHRVLPLLQWAEVGGPIAVGLLLFAPNIAIADAVVARLRRRPFRPRGLAVGLAIPVAAAIIGQAQAWYIDWRVSSAERVHVGLAQANLPPPALRDRVERFRREMRITQELRRQNVDFVVWTETVVLGVPEQHAEAYLQTLFTRQLGVPTLIGAVLTRGEGRERRLLNSALATGQDGKLTGRYEKHLLFPVGERLPLFDSFPGLYAWLPNAMNFAPGTSLEPIQLAGHPVTVLICYEDIFPGFVNDAVNRGRPEMLINLTNDAWFGDTSEPWMHLALAKFRAVEHRRYLLRATNSGVSAVIDPAGRIVAQGGTFREQAVAGTAHWIKARRTPYELWGNLPWWLATIGAGVMASRRRPRPAA
jgi:apolipoprotein N-acyltransferase